MITLDHWVYPGWVADQGAWDNAKTPQDWLANARKIVSRYAGKGAIWITFNEPTWYLKNETVNRPLLPHQVVTMQQALVSVHGKAYDLIHELDPGAMVSTNMPYIPGIQGLHDLAFLDQVAEKLDFVGIDYYYGASVENFTAINGSTDEFWKIDYQAEGLLYALRKHHRRLPFG